jgi:hypothetical protein
MRHQKEYAILAVVIVALGLYLFLRDSDRTTYTLPELPPIKAQDITKIEIAQADRTVVLMRSGGGWQVAPGDYPADDAQVERMLDTLATLDVTALVSATRSYDRYQLDDTHRIHVTAYKDGKVLRELSIGKAADTMRHTHVSLSDDPNVYHARGNFRDDFDKSVADLRDKTVLAFDRDAVTTIAIEVDGDRVTIQKIAAADSDQQSENPSKSQGKEAAPRWQTDDGGTIADGDVDRLLQALDGLQCRTYLAGRSKDEFSAPSYRIRIEGKTTSMLEVFKPTDTEASEVRAASSLRQEPFTLADFDIDPIKEFLKALKIREDEPTQ